MKRKRCSCCGKTHEPHSKHQPIDASTVQARLARQLEGIVLRWEVQFSDDRKVNEKGALDREM